MRTTSARVAALLLLAVAASFAFSDRVGAPARTVAHSAAAAGVDLRDDAHVVAAVPARATDWIVGHQRAPQGNDHLVAVLLAVAVLLVAQFRHRVAFSTRWCRAARRGHRTGIRGPPAFA